MYTQYVIRTILLLVFGVLGYGSLLLGSSITSTGSFWNMLMQVAVVLIGSITCGNALWNYFEDEWNSRYPEHWIESALSAFCWPFLFGLHATSWESLWTLCVIPTMVPSILGAIGIFQDVRDTWKTCRDLQRIRNAN